MTKIKKKENMKLIKIKGNDETIVMRNICSYYPLKFFFEIITISVVNQIVFLKKFDGKIGHVFRNII